MTRFEEICSLVNCWSLDVVFIFKSLWILLRGGDNSERWVPGVWLGKKHSSDEHWVGPGSGKVSTTRSLRVKHVGETWNAGELSKVIGTP